jgi:hypothetical protein
MFFLLGSDFDHLSLVHRLAVRASPDGHTCVISGLLRT